MLDAEGIRDFLPLGCGGLSVVQDVAEKNSNSSAW